MVMPGTDDFASVSGGVVDTPVEVSDEEMPEGEETTPEDDTEQMPEAEAVTPPKGYIPQKDLDALRSTKDREVAQERQHRLALEAQNKVLLQQIEQVEQGALELRVSNMTEDEARLARKEYELDKRVRAIEMQQRTADMTTGMAQKQEAARYLASQYGVPEEDLMDADSPTSMKMLAEKLSKYHRQEAKQARVDRGTDKLGSGVPSGRAPTSMVEADRRFANGQMSERDYSKYRDKFLQD